MDTLRKIIPIWFGLIAIIFPLKYVTIPFHEDLVKYIFLPITRALTKLFGIKPTYHYFISDGIHLNLLVAFLLLIAFLTFLLSKNWQKQKTLILITSKITLYFVAFTLLRYGFMKIFKQQFYMPEPNILATRFGSLDKDILYWSTMGTSYVYSMFLGLTEVVCAALILIKKTRKVGLYIAIGICLNIVFVNFGFNISVKLLSCLLLLMTAFSLSQIHQPVLASSPNKPWLKAIIMLFFLFESTWPSIAISNLNDDKAKRPYLHGAYHDLNPTADAPVKIFIHRDLYFITENIDGSIDSDPIEFLDSNAIHFKEYDTHYPPPISYQLLNDTLIIKGKRYLRKDWKQNKAVQQSWSWLVE